MFPCWMCKKKGTVYRIDGAWWAGCSDKSCYAIGVYKTKAKARQAWNRVYLEQFIFVGQLLAGEA